MKIGNISEKEFRKIVTKAAKDSNEEMKKIWIERKPYNPPKYKMASKWFIFRVKLFSRLKRLFK
jgi:hypothetical protein